MLGVTVAGLASVGVLLAFVGHEGPSAEVLIGIGTILTAILGPFAAEQAAHKLATHEAKKRAATELFVAIATHIQELDEALSLATVREERNRALDAMGKVQRSLYADCIVAEFLLGSAGLLLRKKIASLSPMALPWGNHSDLFDASVERARDVRRTLDECRTEMLRLWREMEAEPRF